MARWIKAIGAADPTAVFCGLAFLLGITYSQPSHTKQPQRARDAELSETVPLVGDLCQDLERILHVPGPQTNLVSEPQNCPLNRTHVQSSWRPFRDVRIPVWVGSAPRGSVRGKGLVRSRGNRGTALCQRSACTLHQPRAEHNSWHGNNSAYGANACSNKWCCCHWSILLAFVLTSVPARNFIMTQ